MPPSLVSHWLALCGTFPFWVGVVGHKTYHLPILGLCMQGSLGTKPTTFPLWAPVESSFMGLFFWKPKLIKKGMVVTMKNLTSIMNDPLALFSQGSRLILQRYDQIHELNPNRAKRELLAVIRLLRTHLRHATQIEVGGTRQTGYHQREPTRQLECLFNEDVPMSDSVH